MYMYTYLLDVFHTLGHVELLLSVQLGVVGVDEDGGVGVQRQLNHLPTGLGQVGQVPQQLKDLHVHVQMCTCA